MDAYSSTYLPDIDEPMDDAIDNADDITEDNLEDFSDEISDPLGDQELELEAIVNTVQIAIQNLEGRKRQVEATLQVPVSPDSLWQVLTDYEHLADFIPNLTRSRLLPHPEGGIRLEQVGGQRILKVRFSARVVLDMIEQPPHRIDFTMVEGDFKEFSGYWQLTPQGKDPDQSTELKYSLAVRPKLTMPVKFLECRLNIDLPRNLAAIYRRALAQTP
jgi:ribosome-associated toxin RatA of RatAB toxin-antitoxin module